LGEASVVAANNSHPAARGDFCMETSGGFHIPFKFLLLFISLHRNGLGELEGDARIVAKLREGVVLSTAI